MPILSSNVVPATAPFEIEQSLRFNDDDTAILSRTPSSEGNRKTWTWSGWVKRGAVNLGSGAGPTILSSGSDAANRVNLRFLSDTSDCLDFTWIVANVVIGNKRTNAVFRDASAWYHIVAVLDTDNATADDRMRLYINGEKVTSFRGETNPSQGNSTCQMNSTNAHYIGRDHESSYRYFDGYLAEVNFIDGQALDSTYFGETGDYGEWKSKKYTGTYGTNGFYLPFKQDYQVEGFSTVTYLGNGVNTGDRNYIGGVGFQPDFVWAKRRNSTGNHALVDAVRGVRKSLRTNSTIAEIDDDDKFISFDTDGFTVGPDEMNDPNDSYVAWSWDMGGSNASNTDGSITSTVRANTTYGQSIVSYTGTGSSATIGHGLSSAPEMVIVKNRDVSSNWYAGHIGVDATSPWNYRMILQDTDARGNEGAAWNDTAPTASVFSIGTSGATNGSGNGMIAYCFHSVSGYSKFGSYTGTGSSGNSVTTGFKPAFLMVKRTDSTSNWSIVDSTRSPVDERNQFLFANANASDNDLSAYDTFEFTDTGFVVNDNGTMNGGTNINLSGGTYIYMAFADTREFAYWLDQSGNNNDWTSNNLTESDISVDSPTNNFATFNSVDKGSGMTLSEGNLKCKATSDFHAVHSTFLLPQSGKWYFEGVTDADGDYATDQMFGIAGHKQPLSGSSPYPQSYSPSVTYHGSGGYGISNSWTYGSLTGTTARGVIVGFAINFDTSKVNIYINGTLTHSNISIPSTTEDWVIYSCQAANRFTTFNFGQDSSFAGIKTAQGNTDGNDIGDFYYTPPSGYLALCTANLPDPAVIPSEHFNTVLYTGDGTSSRDITGVPFQPDFTWIKERSLVRFHRVFDVIRGTGKKLYTNDTSAELTTSTELNAFNSDGFNIGSDAGVNQNSQTFVAWNWKANGSGSSNTNGSITSTVSANQDAGFSIVSYSGTGSAATVGHGLSQAPEMLIVKNRTDSTGRDWLVGHTGITLGSGRLYLNSTVANSTSYGSVLWNNTAPTSTVFSVGTDVHSGSAHNFIAYCFHSVDGFSKVGSYTGNGSTDGPFVYTGFRPAFVLVKRTTSARNWQMMDNVRSPYNPIDKHLHPNLSNAEASADWYDSLANGFKIRATWDEMNSSGDTFIYMAFAEHPFKYTNAR